MPFCLSRFFSRAYVLCCSLLRARLFFFCVAVCVWGEHANAALSHIRGGLPHTRMWRCFALLRRAALRDAPARCTDLGNASGVARGAREARASASRPTTHAHTRPCTSRKTRRPVVLEWGAVSSSRSERGLRGKRGRTGQRRGNMHTRAQSNRKEKTTHTHTHTHTGERKEIKWRHAHTNTRENKGHRHPHTHENKHRVKKKRTTGLVGGAQDDFQSALCQTTPAHTSFKRACAGEGGGGRDREKKSVL